MQKIIAILDHLVVERIEEPLIHRLGVPQCGHVFVHLSELLGEIALLRFLQLLEPAEDGLLEARHSPVQRPEFVEYQGELRGVVLRIPRVLRQRFLRFRA